MRIASLPLLATAIASAFSVQQIPLPAGSQLDEADLAVVRPGLLAFVASPTKAYQTSDLGAHWDSIPVPSGSGFESEGIALTSFSSRQIWDGSRWINAVFPPEVAGMDFRWILGDLDNNFAIGYADGDTALHVARSSDSLRTWTSWFQISTRTAPTGIGLGEAEFVGGRIWFQQKGSSRWQTTSDGLKWSAIPYPDGCSQAHISSASGDTLVAIAELAENSGDRFARSTDGGAHWTFLPTDQPGSFVMQATPGSWASVAMDIQGDTFLRSLYASTSPTGPWTLLSSGDFSTMVVDDAIYFLNSLGLHRADLSGLAATSRVAGPVPGFLVRRTGDALWVDLDGNRLRRWSLAAADGSLLASGTARGSFEVPAIRGGTFLSVEGMGAKRLSPF